MNLAIFAGAVSLAVWLYLVFARGGFWRLTLFKPSMNAVLQRRIIAVVPARNEADVIGRSVKSLLKQDDALRVIVIDDASSDDTGNIALRAAEEGGATDRLEVIRGASLPAGWSGKLWAVQQGIEAAEKYAPEFLLLTDADIEHGPRVVAGLAARAEQDRLDLASLMVKLHCSSLPEKLLIPPFVFFFFKLYPPRWISNNKSRVAGAAGGCILIRPEALKHAGGIESIRSEIIDDCALAARVKKTGGRVWLSATDAARSVRPYTTFEEIGRMIARTAFNQLDHSLILLLIAVLGLVFTYVAPIAALFSGASVAIELGAMALALMIVAYMPIVRYYELNPLWTLTLPLAALFYMGATIRSAANYWSGRGGQWKGRTQDRAGAVNA